MATLEEDGDGYCREKQQPKGHRVAVGRQAAKGTTRPAIYQLQTHVGDQRGSRFVRCKVSYILRDGSEMERRVETIWMRRKIAPAENITNTPGCPSCRV